MDNFYHNCPPMMSDGGRQFTDYKTPTRRNEYIKYINGITRDDQYRLFLQTNGSQIENNIWDYHKTNDSCKVNPCVHLYPTRNIPQHFMEEREAHDQRALNNYQSDKPNMGCPPYKDFRMSSTAKGDEIASKKQCKK